MAVLALFGSVCPSVRITMRRGAFMARAYRRRADTASQKTLCSR